MQICVRQPLTSLVADPIGERMAEHGPFNALAQGADWRGKLERLEAELEKLPSAEMPVEHFFARGLYGRQLFIPAGTCLTGRIHKFSQINVLLSGDISVLTEQGIKRLIAPAVIESPAGTKRAGYAHADTVWITFHGTEEVDPDTLEEQLTARTYEEYEAFCAQAIEKGDTKWLGQQ